MTTPPTIDPAPRLHPAGSPRAALWGRLLLAHVLSYPLLFVAAASALSLAIIRYQQALLEAGQIHEATSGLQRWLGHELGLSPGDAARFEIVMKPVGLALGILLVVIHLSALPWAFASAREVRSRGMPEGEAAARRLRRARRWWLVASLGPTSLLVLGGLGGWIWSLTR
jgi:hypothetical protein